MIFYLSFLQERVPTLSEQPWIKITLIVFFFQKKAKTFCKRMNKILLRFLRSKIKYGNKRFPAIAAIIQNHVILSWRTFHQNWIIQTSTWYFLYQGLFDNYMTLELPLFDPTTSHYHASSRMITRPPLHYVTPDTDTLFVIYFMTHPHMFLSN